MSETKIALKKQSLGTILAYITLARVSLQCLVTDFGIKLGINVSNSAAMSALLPVNDFKFYGNVTKNKGCFLVRWIVFKEWKL